MKPEMNFEDWVKFDLRVGEVAESNKGAGKIKVNIGEKTFELDKIIDAEKGDKIIVGIDKDKLIIPLANNKVLKPDADIEIGSRIG